MLLLRAERSNLQIRWGLLRVLTRPRNDESLSSPATLPQVPNLREDCDPSAVIQFRAAVGEEGELRPHLLNQ